MMRPFIAPLPCGCAVDPDRMQLHPIFDLPGIDGILVCCPWCEAVFSAAEYREWAHQPGREIVIQFNAQIIMQRGRVLEIVGMCEGCNSMMVREPCGKKVVHLEADVAVQMLRN